MTEPAPFLSIVTRCYKRPTLLADNRESVRGQTCSDYEQVLLVDDLGRGVGYSHRRMAALAPGLVGEYVFILDDDDLLVCPRFVACMKEIARADQPDAIMVRMDHGELGILPDAETWGRAPVEGHIGMSAFVVRREVFCDHADALSERYAGDYDFIASVFRGGARVHWHDCIASRIQRRSFGAPE